MGGLKEPARPPTWSAFVSNKGLMGGLKEPRGTLRTSHEVNRRCAEALKHIYVSLCDGQANHQCRHAYESALKYVVSMLAALAASQQMPSHSSASASACRVAQALSNLIESDTRQAAGIYESACRELAECSGLGIFYPACERSLPANVLSSAARALLSPRPEALINPLFFQTMPISWVGQAYQAMLAFSPGPEGQLTFSQARRKAFGIYFTPPQLVSYVVENALLSPEAEATLLPPQGFLNEIHVLDPAVGAGDFLAESVRRLLKLGRNNSEDHRSLAQAVAKCVFGIDTDPIAVEIARFQVWAASGFADGISQLLNEHILVGDALSNAALPGWPRQFDAVIGNPPYVASKNGLRKTAVRGQTDSYLMFLSAILDREMVKPGGILAMVLPDALLVRSNAAEFRCRILSQWTLISLLHIRGLFPDAGVANVVPVLRNLPASSPTFVVSRIERAADQQAFARKPGPTAAAMCREVELGTVLAQPRRELLYLLHDEGTFSNVIRFVHGPDLSLAHYEPPFVPLRSLNIKSIYRGEEIGKSVIRQAAKGAPILLGGESISPYAITWEGCYIPESRIRKNRERYARTKILLQKSAPRIVAALDRVSGRHGGYVFPQSVYAIELRRPGIDEYYLLCLLNSHVLNEYVWRTVTAYKLVQPQLEIVNIKALPVRRIAFTTPPNLKRKLVSEGLQLFESELASSQPVRFSELSNFVGRCLEKEPERSDVVHDVLSHIGKEIVDLTSKQKKYPDAEKAKRLERTIAAAEIIVQRLYSSRPEQMTLPW